MRPFKWGVFGTGAVSAKFVAGLRTAERAEATFVASRSMDRALWFAKALRVPEARCGYTEAAALGGVDAIYIATPPTEHAAHAIRCIQAGIPVLIEKPIAFCASDAIRIAHASRENSVFAMEAMWTRFLPASQKMREMVISRELGKVRSLVGTFGSSQEPREDSNIFDPKLGGGALAHLGVYPVSLAQWLFGPPSSVSAMGIFGDTGVDEHVAFQLEFGTQATASFVASICAWAPDDFKVLCESGFLAFRGSIVRPTGLEICRESALEPDQSYLTWKARLRQHGVVHKLAQICERSSRARVVRRTFHYRGNGYNYEADEVRSCVLRGATESSVMPLADSVSIAQTVDLIRRTMQPDTSRGPI